MFLIGAVSLSASKIYYRRERHKTVAAIPHLRDRQMAASRSDRDRFRRLYAKLTHHQPLREGTRWRKLLLPGIFAYLITGLVTASGGALKAEFCMG
jgi:hypothetical protein